jgi:hypothetical protein
MIETILGALAAIGFIGYSIPQVIAVTKAARLQGYSKIAWTLLFVAILAIQVQLVYSGLWLAAVAQVFNTVAAGYTYVQVFRKGS